MAVATFMYEPVITLNQAVLSTYTPEQKAELYKSCPTEVYETDENYELVRWPQFHRACLMAGLGS